MFVELKAGFCCAICKSYQNLEMREITAKWGVLGKLPQKDSGCIKPLGIVAFRFTERKR